MSAPRREVEGAQPLAPPKIARLVPLLREVGNLKRTRAAGSADSVAADSFRRAWAALCGGAPPRAVALELAADATVSSCLGAIDREVLREAELSEAEVNAVLLRAFDAAAAHVEGGLRAEMRALVAAPRPGSGGGGAAAPRFVERLARQPRSGATKVGAPKLLCNAPESHAEHCFGVAACGTLLAPEFGADVETVFLAAAAHHFHNAYLPDSGFAGEQYLGEHLPRVFEAFRRRCLAEVPESLRGPILRALGLIERADEPAARAFHAADVIDRVLQMRHHAEANEFTLRYAMEEAELVHAGPVQSFHYAVLRAARLDG